MIHERSLREEMQAQLQVVKETLIEVQLEQQQRNATAPADLTADRLVVKSCKQVRFTQPSHIISTENPVTPAAVHLPNNQANDSDNALTDNDSDNDRFASVTDQGMKFRIRRKSRKLFDLRRRTSERTAPYCKNSSSGDKAGESDDDQQSSEVSNEADSEYEEGKSVKSGNTKNQESVLMRLQHKSKNSKSRKNKWWTFLLAVNDALTDWYDYYLCLREYYEKHGHCRVSSVMSRNLSSWMSQQRGQKKFLSREQRKLLDDIDFPWEVKVTVSVV